MKALQYWSFALCALLVPVMVSKAVALESDQITKDFVKKMKPNHRTTPPHKNGQAHARFGIPNIDSIVNWNRSLFCRRLRHRRKPKSALVHRHGGQPSGAPRNDPDQRPNRAGDHGSAER